MSQSTTPTQSGSGVAQDVNSNVSHTQLSWKQLNANSNDERRRIRANETSLLDREWEQLDETVFPVVRENLVLVDQLEDAGLTTDITMAHTESTWNMSSDMTDAEHSMDARTRSEEDIPSFAKQGVPIPFTHKDYRIGERELQASRNMGDGLDTMMARTAARKVSEALEDLILYGVPNMSVRSNGNLLTLPGLLNYEDRVQYVGSDWGTGTNTFTDVNQMILRLEQQNFPAGGTGYWLLHGTAQNADLRADYSAGGEVTVRERLSGLSEISEVINVPRMPDGQAVLLKPVPEVIDLARDPDGIQNIQWDQHGGMEHLFKVTALYAPRIKSTIEGATGIVHATGL